MSQVFTIYSIFFLATALVSFFVAFLAWQRRFVKGARELTRLTIAAGIWSFWIIFETAAPTMTEKIFWSKLEYFGAVSTPVFYLIFVLRFTGKDKFLSIKHILLLFIIPAITLAFAITNEKHYLLWSGFSPISAKTNIMEYYHGVWFWFGYMAYNYLLLLLATIYLFYFIIPHTRAFRSQGWVVLIAGLCPWIASVLYLSGSNPVPGLDLVPVSIILSGALFVYAILYLRFLDLAPVARETLVETLPDGILALDGQNRIQDINEAALSFLGIRNKNIIGSPAESSGASVILLLNAAINHESVDLIEIERFNEIKTFRIIKKAIKNQPGSRLVLIRDITDYVSRQNEIRDGEERFHSMFTMFRLMADNMPDMLWAKDLDKKFIFVNKAVCENLIHATDTDEPIGKNDLFFAERERQKYPERRDWYTFGELCQDSDQVVITSRKPEHFDEFGNVRGKFLFLDVRKAPIFNENGVMIGVVGSARDVTLQKKTESDIIAAKEKAEQSDRLKSIFLANMSHEIRTPMNAITGFAGLLIDPDISAEDRYLFANIIQSRSDDLMRIINDILEISRIESGNVTIEKGKVDINRILWEIETVIIKKIEHLNKPHLSLFCDIPRVSEDFTFISDPFIIKQVFTNLIDNAIKFTHAGTIRYGYQPPVNGKVTFFVTDTGIGISPEDQAIIFEHFRQAEGQSPHQYGGTGLGLSICKGSLALLGGEIRVESTPGKGSAFYFTLPYEIPSSIAPSPLKGSREWHKSGEKIPDTQTTDGIYNWSDKKILLVEDEGMNMKLLTVILKRTGAELICAYSGKEVRQLYDRIDTFSIVLLDVRLPDSNGWDLAKEIKALCPKLPVIAQTAYAMSSDREKSLMSGCDDYISKPIKKDQLLGMMAGYIKEK